MLQFDNSYKIDYNKYEKFLNDGEDKIRRLYDAVLRLNETLRSFVMKPEYWYDDNAAAFVKWYRGTGANDIGYNVMYNQAGYSFTNASCAICKQIALAQDTTYQNYPKMKEYSAAFEVWEIPSMANYKTLPAGADIFTPDQEEVKKEFNTCADRTKVNPLIEQLYQNIQEVADIAGKANGSDDEPTNETRSMSSLMLSFGVGLQGVHIENFDANAIDEYARQITNSEGEFTKVLKERLEAAMTQSKLIDQLTVGTDGVIR